MFHKLYILITKSIDSVVDYCYNGNFNTFKWDPIIGNIVAIGFVAFIDKHVWDFVQFLGTMVTLCITILLGTFLPSIYRYYAHKIAKKYATKYPTLGEILKHDKKNRDDR